MSFYRRRLRDQAQIAVREQRRIDEPGSHFYWVLSAPLSDFVHHDGQMSLDDGAGLQDASRELVGQLLSYADWWREHAEELIEGRLRSDDMPDGLTWFPDEVARWALRNTNELAGLEFELAIASGIGL